MTKKPVRVEQWPLTEEKLQALENLGKEQLDADPPTSGQRKSLCGKGRRLFHRLRNNPGCYNPVPSCAVCGNCTDSQVTGANYTYQVYISNPPVNIGVSWADIDILVIVNESSWPPGFYDNQ